jgi:hypothetical protein
VGATGTATLDFGAVPGTNIAEVTIVGQTGILAGSLVEAFMMGDTTATHNAYEHTTVPIRLSCGTITAGAGFVITGSTDWRLDGTFTVHWVWT